MKCVMHVVHSSNSTVIAPKLTGAASRTLGSAQLQIRIYNDEGAGKLCTRATLLALQKSVAPHVKVSYIDSDEVQGGLWRSDCLLFVMPGGADLPYCRKLNGLGNQHIADYVAQGGSYLGICAGGYYGSARVMFEPGTALEVMGDRELSFFPGEARGAAYPGFDYKSQRGAVAAPISFRTAPSQGSQWLLPTAPPLGCSPRHGSSLTASTGAAGKQEAQTLDYCNGGPMFVDADGLATARPGQVDVLARYIDLAGVASAVRCKVGHGVAVLCGTHPEIDPSQLLQGVETAELEDVHDHIKSLAQQLSASRRSRQSYWELLLAACSPSFQLDGHSMRTAANF